MIEVWIKDDPPGALVCNHGDRKAQEAWLPPVWTGQLVYGGTYPSVNAALCAVRETETPASQVVVRL